VFAIPLIAAVALASQDADIRTQMLIDQLRADAVRWNAIEAMDSLAELGPAAVPQLEKALLSDDWQQRMMAADVLRGIDGYLPSMRMLEVCVEGLRDDELPNGHHANGEHSCSPPWNAARGTEFLLLHASDAVVPLVQAMESDDGQQRFLAAFVVGFSRIGVASSRTCQILVYHLKDNGIRVDGILAGSALRRMGIAAVPGLLIRQDQTGGQQRAWIDLLIAHALQRPVDEITALVGRLGDMGWPLSKDPTDVRADQLEAVLLSWWGVD